MRRTVFCAITLPLIFAVSLLVIPGRSSAQGFVTREFQVTSSNALDTTPTLGNDGNSDLVVYTSYPLLPEGTYGLGRIYYQRLSTSFPVGPSVLVSDSPFNDKLNDVSGDHIVYTSFSDATMSAGQIKLYKISTGTTRVVSTWAMVREARIFGSRIAWIQGAPGETTVVTIDINDIGIAAPRLVAGPLPATSHVEIGDRLIVWEERDGGQGDIRAFDPVSGAYYEVETDPMVDDSEPSTYGPWVTWQSYDGVNPETYIKTINVDTGELRILADNGAYNRFPSMDSDLISWEGNASGNFDIYLHYISTGETFQLTDDPADQILNNLFQDKVAYSDNRAGNDDIFVTIFWENNPPDISAIPDQTTDEDTATLPISFTVTDPNMVVDDLTLSAVSSDPVLVPPYSIIFDGTGTDRTLTVTPAEDLYGTATITVTVTDAGGLTANDTFNLTVNPINDAPVANRDMVAMGVDTTETIAVLENDYDVDGDPLSVSILQVPRYGEVVVNEDDTITYTPHAGWMGQDEFIYLLEDDQGASASATVYISVEPMQFVVIANDDSYSVDQNAFLQVAAPGVMNNDIGPADMIAVLTRPPTIGTVVLNEDGSFIYTPYTDRGGTDTFSYDVRVGGVSDSAAVIIKINPASVFTITASAGSNGAISPEGNIEISEGNSQTFIITPDAGYRVADVVVDGISSGPRTSYYFGNVSENHTISASFEPDTHTVTASVSGGGSMDPAGVLTVNGGDSLTFDMVPDAGYEINRIIVDGVNVGTPDSYTFTDISWDHAIKAYFTLIPTPAPTQFTVTAEVRGSGTISPEGVSTVDSGNDVTYTITPDVGYQVSRVIVDGVNMGVITSYTFTNVTWDHYIRAYFILQEE